MNEKENRYKSFIHFGRMFNHFNDLLDAQSQYSNSSYRKRPSKVKLGQTGSSPLSRKIVSNLLCCVSHSGGGRDSTMCKL